MLTIKISGPVAEGKTTLALSLCQWLWFEGFTNVTIKDVDVVLGKSYPELQEQRLEAISEVPVTIETVQLQREPRINNLA